MATPDDLDSEQFTDIGDEGNLDGLEDLTIDEDSEEEKLDDLDYDADEEQDAEAKPEGSSEEESEESDLEDEDPEEEEESLDVILAREQDLEEEFARTDDAPRSSPTSTPPGEDEFTCRSCFLVKRRAQLAPGDEWICLDCA